ncbi:PFGI-1 class ICE element type IV pilus protein PilL2 [Xylophilus sp. ASV27]|uniref:PFGI-1 class ICE element type IV pilus protein PilL2 n=1 Tax=Xylophilus sp. ASV27 TaxID=2795129 RepID=UPI0018EC05C1|nr:hypothetical protein [Xylophilus sp. ASV27]
MTRHFSRNITASAVLLLAGVVHGATPLVEGNKRIQLGRYTTADALPQQSLSEPLELVAHITFPREQVSTIGEAIAYTLLRTGYALPEPKGLAPDAQRFLALPLPEAQRTLGPFSVQDILNVLVGKAWVWQVDPVTRNVWFTLASGPAPRRLQPIVSPSAAAARP